MDEDDGYRDYYYDFEMPRGKKRTVPVRDAVLKQLQKEAEERTWNMYERLEKDHMLYCELRREYLYLKHLRQQNPNIDITVFRRDMLWYHFFLGRRSPYCSLCIQRDKETGDRMLIHDRDAYFYRKGYCGVYSWALEKDKQYILLHEKLSSHDELQLDVSSCETLCKATTVMLNEKLCVAKEIAKNLELNLLHGIDIKQCFTDFVFSQVSMIHMDQTREMHLYLLNEDVQKRIIFGDKSSVLMELNRKFKLLGVVGAELGLDLFWQWGGFSRIADAMMEEMSLDICPNEREEQYANWVKGMKELIERYCKIVGYCKKEKEGYIMKNGFVEYLRLKIELAKEIGIVIKDGEVWREKGWEEFPLD